MDNSGVPPFTIFKSILMYTTFILVAPITTFFVSKFFFFEGIFGTSDISSNVWSAVFAVITLHIAVGLYIYKAYHEAEKVKPAEKTD